MLGANRCSYRPKLPPATEAELDRARVDPVFMPRKPWYDVFMEEKTLRSLRQAFGVTKAKFASYMGVPLRTFEDLEAGRSPLRRIHRRAIERAVLQLAADDKKSESLPPHLHQLIAELSELKRTGDRSNGGVPRTGWPDELEE